MATGTNPPSLQELLDVLNMYQKANRLKHDADFAAFEEAEPLIQNFKDVVKRYPKIFGESK